MLGTLAFALGPALKISRRAVIGDLKQQAGEDVVTRRWKLLPRHPLVVIQIAFSLALLTAAALFIRGAGKAASVDTGLKPGASFLLETDASLAGYEPKRAEELYRNLNARLAALPGVEGASISAVVPFGMISLSKNVQRAGIRPGPDDKPTTAAQGLAFNADWDSVGANYFKTVGLPVVRGRAFNESEATQSGGAKVAIIDDILAKKLWPEGDALGQRIQFAADNAPRAKSGGGNHVGMSEDLSGEVKPDETIEIVGIVPATRHALFEKDPSGSIYLPFAQGFQGNVSFFVRFHSLPAGTEAATADLLRRTCTRCRSGHSNHFVANLFATSRCEPATLDRARWRSLIFYFRRARARPGSGGSLRRKSLFGRASHARNWDSHGFGGATQRGPAHDHARRLDHAAVRRDSWPAPGDGDGKDSKRNLVSSRTA